MIFFPVTMVLTWREIEVILTFHHKGKGGFSDYRHSYGKEAISCVSQGHQETSILINHRSVHFIQQGQTSSRQQDVVVFGGS